MRKITAWMTSTLLALALIVGGCDSFGNDDPDGAAMRVLLTDAPFPFDLVSEAGVTISSVIAVSQDEGEVVLSDDDVTLNLLDLQGGVTDLLAAEDEMPAGVYTRILLNVTDAWVELEDGTEFDVNVPSDRIQILLNNIELDVDEEVTVLLDFDVSQSFVVQGNPNTPAGINGFIFKPVVRSLGYFTDDDDEFEGAELQGVITEVGADYIVVAGTRFHIDDDTEFDDIDGFASLTEGMIVEIEYVETTEDVFVATEIDLEGGDDDDEREVHETAGEITEIGADFLEVGELQFAVDASTRFQGVTGLAGLTVGTEVEVDYVEVLDGEGLLAVEIEVEED